MAAPNIDMIATSLRNCSLGGAAAPSPAPSPFRVMGKDPTADGGAAAAAVTADTTLELNSDVALPYHWEQCLDLKTGKIYYINWSTGAKSMEDPRKFAGGFGERYCSDEDQDDEDGDEADDENDGGASDDGDDSSEEEETAADSDEYGHCSSVFSSSSSASSRDTIERGGTGRGRGRVAGKDSVLVAAGCRICMMYVMIPKKAEACPRCGGHVLHFTPNGGR